MYRSIDTSANSDTAANCRWQRRLALSPDEQAVCDRLTTARVRSFAAHQPVRPMVDGDDQLLIVRRGWLSRTRRSDAVRSQVLSYILPGEVEFVVGQTDIADAGDEAAATVVSAAADTIIALVDRAELVSLRKRFPRVARALAVQLRVAQATQREWLINLGQRSGADRIAHLLCELFMRASVDAPASGGSVRFPLTQAQLGEATGLTPIHVNRILQGLRAAGMVEIRERRLTLPDLPKLMRSVGFTPDYLRLADAPRDAEAAVKLADAPAMSIFESALP